MFSTIGYYICVPFAMLVRLFYNLTSSYGLAIILFTLVIKLIMVPFQMKSKKGMIRMSRMSNQMQELQKQYKNNPQKYNEEVQKLYAEEGVNPMGGCLWSFLPLPILIALYSIIRQPITHFLLLGEDIVLKAFNAASAAGIDMTNIGSMVDGKLKLGGYGQINLLNAINQKIPEFAETVDGWVNVNYNFVGLDLAANPIDMIKNFSFSWGAIGLILIPILAGVLQFVMSKVAMKGQENSAATASTRTMLYFMPLFSVYIAFVMPAALGLYWIAQSAFSAVQEFFMGNFYTKKIEEEEAERAEKIAADRRRRQEEAKLKAAEQREKDLANQENQLRDSKKIAAKRAEKQAKKEAKNKTSTNENGRIGDRPYARGRNFSEDHYA